MPITRNLSDKSVEEYKQSIKVYLEFLEVEKGVINEKVTFDSFTRENIKEFIAWLTEKNSFVTLIGKGRKSRNVPLLNKTVQHLNEYLKEFHPEMNECPLFYSLLDGKPHRLSTDSISLVLKSAADKARDT